MAAKPNSNGKEEIDIHNRRKETAGLLQKIQDSELSEECKQALVRYNAKDKGARINTQCKDLDVSYHYLLWHNKQNVEAITAADNEAWFNSMLDRMDKGSLSWGSVEKYFWLTKKFLRYHFNMKKGKYPEAIDNIEMPKRPDVEDLIELPTQEQIKGIIEKHALVSKAQREGQTIRASKLVRANSPLYFRNQALLSIMNDAGCRITEAVGMNVSDIKQAEGKNYLLLHFPVSKTKPRTVIGYLCKPYITKWLQNYQHDNQEAPLFPDRFGNRLSYVAARQLVLRAFAAGGVELPERKATSVFRHMMASRCSGWGEDIKYAWFGWSKSKRISLNYTHIKPVDFEKPYFELNAGNCMMPKECPICSSTESNGFCEQCGATLGLDNVLAKESKENNLLIETMQLAFKNPAMQKEVLGFMVKMAQKTGMNKKILAENG